MSVHRGDPHQMNNYFRLIIKFLTNCLIIRMCMHAERASISMVVDVCIWSSYKPEVEGIGLETQELRVEGPHRPFAPNLPLPTRL